MDTQASLRMQLLVRESDIAMYAFHLKSTDDVMLVPAGMPELNTEIQKRMEQGFVMVAVVAIMKTSIEDGHVLIEYEAMPGASEEAVQKAKVAFTDELIERGIIKPDAPVN